MAAFDHIQGGMYGISLKPRLLHSLIKEKLPDEKHPFRDSSEILYVASTVRIHRLLSESTSQSIDQKLMENWKSFVDSWVNRLLILVCSNMPDKCWAGICLLGVTCEECSPERFLASYSGWFNKLLSHIQICRIDDSKLGICGSPSVNPRTTTFTPTAMPRVQIQFGM